MSGEHNDTSASGKAPGHPWGAGIDALAAEEAIGARQHRYWRAQEMRESTTLMGVLRTLADHQTEVRLTLDHGQRFVGTVTGTGSDLVSLQCRDGRRVVIALPQVMSLKPAGRAELTGDRGAVEVRLFAEAIADLCVDNTQVAVHLTNGQPLHGTLKWCGEDVCCIAGPPDPRSPTYVPLRAISAVTVIP